MRWLGIMLCFAWHISTRILKSEQCLIARSSAFVKKRSGFLNLITKLLNFVTKFYFIPYIPLKITYCSILNFPHGFIEPQSSQQQFSAVGTITHNPHHPQPVTTTAHQSPPPLASHGDIPPPMTSHDPPMEIVATI